MPMATTTGRVVTYNKEFPSIKLEDPLIAWSCNVTRQINVVSTTTMTMATKFGRAALYNEELPAIKSLIKWFMQGHLTNKILYISTTSRPLAIKLGKVMSYYKVLPPIKSHNPLNTWSFEIT